MTASVLVGPAIVGIVATAIGGGLIAYRKKLVALSAQVGAERIGRVFVPALGGIWLAVGVFGLAASVLSG